MTSKDKLSPTERKALIEAVNELYKQRFGDNWREIMTQKLALFKKGALKEDADFLRFMQLGAFIANRAPVMLDRIRPTNEPLLPAKNLKLLVPAALKAYKYLGINLEN